MNLKQIYKNVCGKLKETGVESAELDTTVIIAHVLQKDKTFVLSHPEFELGESQKEKILDLANKRSKSVPIAYLTGHKEFFGYDFLVDERVLIPRPETESLVEQALVFVRSQESAYRTGRSGARLPDRQVGSSIHHTPYTKLLTILDVGTGSGCIIISLMNSLCRSAAPPLRHLFYATDISEQALDVAKKNAETHGVQDKITFFHSDLFANPRLPEKFDLILANLPYVPRQVKSQKPACPVGRSKIKSVDFEPQDAIFADDNGAEIINRFLDQASSKLNQDGLILIELDPRNANEIKKTTECYFPTAEVTLRKDLANLDRYLIIQT